MSQPLAQNRVHSWHDTRLCHSVIPTEAEGSRAVCGTQEGTLRPVKRLRMCKDLRHASPRTGRDPSTSVGMTDLFPFRPIWWVQRSYRHLA
jgi:hypothetical protein